jgi:hypothetical protein
MTLAGRPAHDLAASGSLKLMSILFSYQNTEIKE